MINGESFNNYSICSLFAAKNMKRISLNSVEVN